MRYTIDTEFVEYPCTIDLMSIGIVREDGERFYAISSECDLSKANDWVKANVIPKLGDGPRLSRAVIRDSVVRFVGADRPEFWGYYSDYDWVVFCWLFGAMIDLPKGWPMFCMDLKQLMVSQGVGSHTLPPLDPMLAHNALEDAAWEMAVLKQLTMKQAVAR